MRNGKLRPSPSLVISVMALIMAATGTAAALHNSKASTAGPVKGKSAVGFCNPASTTFVDCVTLKMKLPHSGPVMLVGTGSWRGDADAANGQCHIVAPGGGQVGLAPNPGQNVGAHADGGHEGSFAITGVTDELSAGKRTFKLTCQEATADFAVDSAELSAVLLN